MTVIDCPAPPPAPPRLLSVALFYLVVGVIFQAAIKKERGIRVLPNYDFWCSVFTSVLVSVFTPGGMTMPTVVSAHLLFAL